MVQRIAKLVAVSAVLVSVWSAPAWADYRSGVAAYERGQYEAARKALEPLARKGDGNAQYYLGLMYAEGRGVSQDDALAVEWFTCASEGSASFGKKQKAGRLSANLAESAGLGGAIKCRFAPSAPALSEQAQQALYYLVRDGAVQKLLFMPGDLLVMATIAAANASGLPWVADMVLAACSITRGWITALIGLIVWCFFGLMVIRVVSAMEHRLPSGGKLAKTSRKNPRKSPERDNDNTFNVRFRYGSK